MATTTAAKKAIRSSARRRVFTLRRIRAMREAVKVVETTKKEEGLKDAYKAIDKATKLGVLKKNTASRKKSRLARLVAGK